MRITHIETPLFIHSRNERSLLHTAALVCGPYDISTLAIMKDGSRADLSIVGVLHRTKLSVVVLNFHTNHLSSQISGL